MRPKGPRIRKVPPIFFLQGKITNMLPVQTPGWAYEKCWRIVVTNVETKMETIVYAPDSKHFYQTAYMDFFLRKGSVYTGNIQVDINVGWEQDALLVLEIIDPLDRDPEDYEVIYDYRHPDALEMRE